MIPVGYFSLLIGFICTISLGCSSAIQDERENPLVAEGRRMYDLGQYENAQKHFTNLLDQAQSDQNTLLEAQCKKWLGNILLAYKKDEEAFHYYLQSKALLDTLLIPFDSLGKPSRQILLDERQNVLNNIAVILKDRGDYEEAERIHRVVLEYDRKKEERLPIAVSLYNIGILYNLKADQDRLMERDSLFRENLRKAKELFTESLSVYPTADAYLNLGNAYALEGEYDSAVTVFSRAESIYSEKGYRVHQAMCLGNIGILLREEIKLQESGTDQSNENVIENLDAAAAALKKGIVILEELRGNLSSIDVRSSFISNKFYLYENLVEILVAQGKIEESFEFVERAKARSFLDLLGNKVIGNEKIRSHEAIKLIDEERSLQTQITQLIEIPDSMKRVNFLINIHQQVLNQLRRLDPEYVSVKSIDPLPIRELQKFLDDSTAILEYFLGETSSFVFAVTRDTIVARKLNISAETNLEAKIEQIRKKIYSVFPNQKIGYIREARLIQKLSVDAAKDAWYSTRTDPSWQYDLMTMYSLVISPVERYLREIKQIYVIPHGPLHHLPFQSLIKIGNIDKRPNVHIARPRFLIEDVAIAYLPSASVLKFAREKKAVDLYSALIIGDPLYADPVFRKRPLKGALIEADSVARFVKKPEVLKREAAEEAVVKKEIGMKPLVHFATHGELNKREPLKSRILLAAANPDAANDGNLTIAEVFNLALNASLVTLSACQTAQVVGEEGKFNPGDDLVGLTRSFFYAGTPSVLASMWYVDDEATLAWMNHFYRAWLKEKMPKVQAARKASLEMLSHPLDADWIFPYYWGAFILFGDM